MTIIFLHGWHSTPGGVKPTYLKSHGHEVLNPALPDEDFDEAVRIAQTEFDRGKPDVVVGSSRGGAVAMNIEAGETPLVLLCPAWKRWGTTTKVKVGTVILHSPADDVVPFADSEELARNSGLPLGSLIETGTEHRLADPESLAKMLETVELNGRKADGVGGGSRRREAGVPRQFGIGILMVMVTMYAVLFAVMRALRFPPTLFFIVALFFTVVGLGQMFLYKGQRPRRASAMVGIWFMWCLAGITLIIEGVKSGFSLAYSGQLVLGFAFLGFLYGAICGYVAGLLIAGVFVLIDALAKRRGGSETAEPIKGRG